MENYPDCDDSEDINVDDLLETNERRWIAKKSSSVICLREKCNHLDVKVSSSDSTLVKSTVKDLGMSPCEIQGMHIIYSFF